MSKKFYCNYCNFRTIRKFRLEDHFKKEHTELTTIINKKNIILIFFQKYFNENIIKTIESFYKNFENLKNIKKTICILKNNSLIDKLPKCIDEKIFYSCNNFCFKNLKNKLLEFDYMLYFDDSYKLLKKINIFKELDIFFKNKNYKQLIFKKDDSDNIILNYYDKKFSLPIFKNINYIDKYYIHDNIEIRNDKNIYKNNFISLDYHDYLKKNFINWPHFKLLPSIIKTDIFKEIKTELNTNIYLQKKFCYEFYDKKFISINLFESIIEENDNKLLNNDYKDMTIVTGFIYIKKDEGNKKHKYNYLEKSKKTLELKNNMFIYISENLYDHVYTFRKKLGLEKNTKIIVVSMEDLYLYDQIDKIKKNTEKNIDTYKNPLYIMAVNSRYKFIKRCIEENPFNNNYYAWIDFSASHIVRFPKDMKIKYNNPHKIRLSWIGRCKIEKRKFFYHHKCMGGGIFAGHKDIMLEFIDLHDKYFRNFMEMGYNINDDKLLFFMFEKYPELFDFYFSSYHDILLKL